MAKVIIDEEIHIMFKTPNAVDSIEEAVRINDTTDDGHEPLPLSRSEKEELNAERVDKVEEIKRKLERWIRFGENVTLVYNTKTDTLKVK